MNQYLVEKLARELGHGKAHRGQGGEWYTLCPAHDDETPSLSLKVGDRVPVVWHCMSRGCTNEEVLAALKDRGLWPLDRERADRVIQFRPQASEPRNAKPTEEWVGLIPVPDDAPAFHKTPGARCWEYRSEDNQLIGYIERIDRPDGRKDFYPHTLCRFTGSGRMEWRRQAFPTPRPLYGLRYLKEKPAARVLIVAGEKCADAGMLVVPDWATVSASGGEKAAAKTDWTPLNGRNIDIWPDNDIPGRRFAEEVKALLLKLDNGRCVRIMDIPEDFPAKIDIADLADGTKGAGYHWTSEQIAAFVQTGSVPPKDRKAKSGLIGNSHFVVLGKDHHKYYFRHVDQPQLLCKSENEVTPTFMVSLAPLGFWERRYMGRSGVDWKAAQSDIFAISQSLPVFHANQRRGRGAWKEPADSFVWHGGAKAYRDGIEISLGDLNDKSRFFYEAKGDLKLDLSEPLNDKEAAFVLNDVCKKLPWRDQEIGADGKEKSKSALLFAGWLVLAPFGGALAWRPHIWLSGPAGAGKTTIMDRILKPMLADMAEYFESASTAAGVIGALDGDSRPVIFDEAERNGKPAEKRIEDILELIMSASGGGGRIVKGTIDQGVRERSIRVCFALASINTAARDTQAAARRITLLELVKRDDLNQWRKLRKNLDLLPPGERLVARTLRYFKVLRRNIDVFREAMAERLGDQALGDQFGPLLAGAHLMVNSREVSTAAAKKWVNDQHWGDHTPHAEDRDEQRSLGKLMSHMVRIGKASGNGAIDATVAQLVRLGADQRFPDEEEGEEIKREVSPTLARQQLLKMGIRVREGASIVYIAHRNSELERLFRDTPWSRNWGDSMERLPNAEANVQQPFASGRPQRAVGLPLITVFQAPQSTPEVEKKRAEE